jgi:hypothetical protein
VNSSEFVTKCDAAHRQKGFDFAKEDEAYTEAFQQFGVDARVLGAQEIADHASATTIRLELASALDNWAFTR